MALTVGTRLGSYEITGRLGVGGMGEVYRARDTKLGRQVAIKILPANVAGDRDRIERLAREAQILASLNHPNIAAIHHVEDVENGSALVMELVEGDTLADRLAAGAMSVDEALPLARQIADALAAAHASGVVHRDLKPANIKLRVDGTVKVLDFGLAKAIDPGGVAAADHALAITQSPTITAPGLTGIGVILGTAAYMSPEQAKGRTADNRSDIWAFGCVLYEMLTGRRAFEGEDVSDTLAAILRGAPDWAALPADTPTLIRALLRRCLERDRNRRLADASTAIFVIDECASASDRKSLASSGRNRWLWPGVATALAAALLTLAIVHFRETPPAPPRLMRLQVTMPDGVIPLRGAVLSPDGHAMAFPSVGTDGIRRLWVRSLDSTDARLLPGTEGIFGTRPFWSPDSRFLAFEDAGKLKKLDVAGGQAQTLCDVPVNVLGGSWNRDGVILFGNNAGGLMRVSDAGGTAIPVTASARSTMVFDSFPSFLADGRHFLYSHSERNGTSQSRGIYLGELGLKPEEQSRTPLVADAIVGSFARSSDLRPYVLFLRDNTLFAQPFDDRQLQVTGEAVPVAEQVGLFNGDAMFSASDSEALIYRAGLARPARLTWFDRNGKTLDTVTEPIDAMTVAVSPDGTRAAVRERSTRRNALLVDLARGVTTRLTADIGSGLIWSPDGTRVAYQAVGGIYQRAANGTGVPELLLQLKETILEVTDWSPDGRFLLYTSARADARGDLWMLPLDGERKPVPILQSESNEIDAHISPDLHWVAYASDESGTVEIYVRSFSARSAAGNSIPEGKWLISKGGGTAPRWRRDGRELFYLGSDGRVMAVEIAITPAFQPGIPKALFQVPAGAAVWDVAADGTRFLLPALAADATRAPFTLVLNWTQQLRR
jgi:serine/threonine protein kinase/Tol biopolymer transport system component